MASIKDIARESGVSVTTVSRALNDHNDVSEATKARVREVAKRLNYSPNIQARNLVMQKSNRIGFVVFDFGLAAGEDNFVYEMMVGMQRRCIASGYDLLFLFGSVHTSENSDIPALIKKYDLCGIVIMGCGKHFKTYRDLQTIQSPVALIDGDIETDFVGTISVDNYAAAREAMEYLLTKKKRKRILLINGKEDSFASLERLRAYREALGGRFREEDVFYAEYSDKRAQEVVSALVAKDGSFPYDAVFATSDMMAVGAQNALLARGFAVGREVDIIGFDNIPLGAFIHTPLTTVAQDKIRLGEEAVNMLLNILCGESAERRVIVPHKLILRDSA